jgi:hypothetical protein
MKSMQLPLSSLATATLKPSLDDRPSSRPLFAESRPVREKGIEGQIQLSRDTSHASEPAWQIVSACLN